MSYQIKNNAFVLLIFLILFFHPLVVVSQCTGEDKVVEICEKEKNTDNQSLNLFDSLGGTPSAGGTWTAQNPTVRNALSVDGTLNLWIINRFGDYVFTYSHPNCSETADVTVRLGGYPGEDNIDGGANACSDNSSVDLFCI